MDDIQLTREIRTCIKQGDAEGVVRLIGHNNQRLAMMTVFGTWAHVAARMGQLEILRRLVDMGADINAKGGISGGKPINEASAEGHVDIVKYLISIGAELDVEISEQNPLFSAIYGGHTEVAKALIDAGIDIHKSYTGKLMNNMDALAFAREWGRADIIDLLQERAKK